MAGSTASNLSFASRRSSGTTRVGYSPVRHARQSADSGPLRRLLQAVQRGHRNVRVTFPHRDFDRDAGLEVERTETFRFTLLRPLDVKPAVRLLNGLDRRLGGHNGVGDLIALVARKPG